MQRSNRVVLMLSGGVMLSGVVSGALSLGWDAWNAARLRAAAVQTLMGGDIVPSFGARVTENSSDTQGRAPRPKALTPIAKPDKSVPRFRMVALNTGGAEFYPIALNNRGEILGGILGHQTNRSPRLDAFLYRGNTLTRLPPLKGYKYSWPMALNNRGQAVCIAHEPLSESSASLQEAGLGATISRAATHLLPVAPEVPTNRVVLWENNVLRDLGISEQLLQRGVGQDIVGSLYRSPLGLNDQGQITMSLDSLYYWSKGEIHLAGRRLPNSSLLLPLNNQGILVRPSARALASGFDRSERRQSPRALEWYDVSRQRETSFSAGEMWDMNDKSEVLCSNFFAGDRPVRQYFVTDRQGKRRTIATVSSFAKSFINNKGHVVGLASRYIPLYPPGLANQSTPSPPQAGPFWSQNNRLYDLNDLIPAQTGWTILLVHDFNDRDEILVSVLGPDRRSHPMLLRPETR